MMKLTIFILTEKDSNPLEHTPTPETNWNGDIEATLSVLEENYVQLSSSLKYQPSVNESIHEIYTQILPPAESSELIELVSKLVMTMIRNPR